jgi:4-amino-4-deoxy-L-arabinose transferase-like glycosyltransferase
VSSALIKWFGWQPIPAGHFLNLLTASAGLVALFYLGTFLFNPTVGLVAEIFMALFPRFIGNAHFNEKDVPMMVFGTVALLLLNLAARKGQVRYWILAALGTAVAVTTKLDGLFVLPIFLVPWLLTRLWSENRRADLRNVGWFLCATAFFIYLLWPELWTDPLHLFQSVSGFAGGWPEEPDITLGYLGHNYPDTHLPWHYHVMQFIAATPLILLLSAGAGMAWSLYRLFHRQDSFKHGLLWCWILFPVLPRMLPGIIKYDGMRHIFLIVPAVAIMAGLGIGQLLARWRGWPGYKLAPIVGCAAIVWSGWQILECHPYEGFYLNEAVRAVVPGPRLVRYFDFNGWGTPYTQGVEWINAHARFHASVSTEQYPYFLDFEGLRDDLTFTEDKDKADYVLGCWNGKAPAGFHNPPAFCLRCYGANILCVYTQNRQ